MSNDVLKLFRGDYSQLKFTGEIVDFHFVGSLNGEVLYGALASFKNLGEIEDFNEVPTVVRRKPQEVVTVEAYDFIIENDNSFELYFNVSEEDLTSEEGNYRGDVEITAYLVPDDWQDENPGEEPGDHVESFEILQRSTIWVSDVLIVGDVTK